MKSQISGTDMQAGHYSSPMSESVSRSQKRAQGKDSATY